MIHVILYAFFGMFVSLKTQIMYSMCLGVGIPYYYVIYRLSESSWR